jgi:hypothetical protein
LITWVPSALHLGSQRPFGARLVVVALLLPLGLFVPGL